MTHPKQLLAMTAALSMLAAFPARANPDADLVTAFGLIGVWAPDCAAQPSEHNPQLTFLIARDGTPQRRLLMRLGYRDGQFDMTEVRRSADNQLAYRDKRTGEATWFEVVLQKTGDGLQTLGSKDANGNALVRDGKFVESGKPTLVFHRCHDAPRA